MCNCAVGLDSLPTEPGPPTIAVPASHERSRGSGLEGSLNSQTASLALPQDEVITISVVSGLSQGMEFELSTPLVTIGRLGGGADIEIDDSEVSRSHCAIEVRRDASAARSASYEWDVSPQFSRFRGPVGAHVEISNRFYVSADQDDPERKSPGKKP